VQAVQAAYGISAELPVEPPLVQMRIG
jgi:hypothetical protein